MSRSAIRLGAGGLPLHEASDSSAALTSSINSCPDPDGPSDTPTTESKKTVLPLVRNAANGHTSMLMRAVAQQSSAGSRSPGISGAVTGPEPSGPAERGGFKALMLREARVRDVGAVTVYSPPLVPRSTSAHRLPSTAYDRLWNRSTATRTARFRR